MLLLSLRAGRTISRTQTIGSFSGKRPAISLTAAGFVLALLVGSQTCFATTRYVNAARPDDSGSGLNWAAAKKTLQAALADALPGDEVWVSAGVYRPDDGGGQTPGDRAATFQLLNNVAIYGSFAGFETMLSERDIVDIATSRSVLDGDLMGNDNPNFVDYEDNSYHVVTSIGNDATAILDGFVVRGGSADATVVPDYYGGGLYAFDGSPTIRKCIFTANRAEFGGGIWVGQSNSLIDECTFVQNRADTFGTEKKFPAQGGGLTIAELSNVTVTNSQFLQNNAANSGAGLFMFSAAVTLSDCLFSNNSAEENFDRSGAALKATDSTVIASRCTFQDNEANDGGAILHLTSISAVYKDCWFIGNTAGNGGAIHNVGTSPALWNCKFLGNYTTVGGGGAIRNVTQGSPSSPTLLNCLFSGNFAQTNGGAMWGTGSSWTAINCTFSKNRCFGAGGAIRSDLGGTRTLRNCILWQNEDAGGADQGGQIDFSGGTLTASFNIIQGLSSLAGNNNVDSDPLFVDDDGDDNIEGTNDDKLQLSVASPAVDTGDDTALPADSADLDGDADTGEVLPIDLDGQQRVVDGDEDAMATVDRGAYEYFPDCNNNGINDSCDLSCGATNGPCDVPGCGASIDCNSPNWPADGIDDQCDIDNCPDGNPNCDDCNRDGVPDACNIFSGFSLDVAPMDDRPDECANFTASCNPPTDEWDCVENWDIPGDVYPDNGMSAGYSVTLEDAVDNVCLNVNVAINTLDVAKGATLRVTQPDVPCAGAFALDRALILPSSSGSETEIEARGSPTTLDIVAIGGMNIEGTAGTTSTVTVASDNQINVTTGTTSVSSGGLYRIDPNAIAPSSAELNTSELVIESNYCDSPPGCPNGGAVCLTEGMKVNVVGDLKLDGRLAVGATCGTSDMVCGPSPSRERKLETSNSQEASLGGYTPPLLRALDGSSIVVTADLSIQGAAELLLDPMVAGDKPLTLGGDFINESTNPTCFNAGNGGIVLNGSSAQVFEAASTDVGETGGRGVPAGNFGIGAIEITAGTPEDPHVVTFRDSYDNDALGQASCDEAVYVGRLTLGANVQVILDNCRLYADATVVDPAAVVVELGCGTLLGVPIPPELTTEPRRCCMAASGSSCATPPPLCTSDADCAGLKHHNTCLSPASTARNRFVGFVVPPAAANRGPSELTAIRVTLTTLNHPRFCCTSTAGTSCSGTTCNEDAHCTSAPHLTCAHQAAPGTPDFSAFEGKIRYVNSFPGLSPPHVCAGKGPPHNFTFRCATLGCEPEYRDWATELQVAVNLPPGAPDTPGLLFITESALVPSSTVHVSQIAAGCGSSATANACAAASTPLAVGTARWADITSVGFRQPDGKSDVLDIPAVTNFLKDASPFFGEERTWLKQRDPRPDTDAITVIELSDVVDGGPQARPYVADRTIDSCSHD